MTQGIYEIRNKLNGKVYVGSSIDIEKRWRKHHSTLRRRQHGNPHLQAAWNKYGEGAFVFAVLEVVEDGALLATEQGYLDELFASGDCYNMGQDATAPWLGRTHTDAARRKLSDAGMGNQHSKGYKHTAETKRRMSESHKGHTLSEEHKRKISESHMGKKLSKEHRRKLGEANRGKKHSAETRRKMSKAAMGHQRGLGYKHTDEARRKIGEASRRMWERKREGKGVG